MEIEFDPDKCRRNIELRGLDFRDAPAVLEGPALTYLDERFDYGEPRWITVGLLNQRMIIVVWTPCGEVYRIISMRKANEREQESYSGRLG